MASAFMWMNNIHLPPEPVYIRVGGEIFTTTISTLTKYPNSVLANMCKKKEEEENPDFLTETIQYFTNQPKDKESKIVFSLDSVNPEYFRAILYFLRLGEITWRDLENKEDPHFLKGVLQLANDLGVKEQIWEALHRGKSEVIQRRKRAPIEGARPTYRQNAK